MSPILEIDGLVKHFGGLVVLDGVSATVNEGEVVGLIGPNGAGKTTFFNIVTGFLEADEGDITLGDTQVLGMAPHEIAQQGMVRTFQQTRLFHDLTVAENILIGMHLNQTDTILSILRSGLRGSFSYDPLDRESERIERILRFIDMEKQSDTVASSLAYGQQRRLEIGIALGADPELLLLDEPVAGMNDVETRNTMEFVQDLNETNPVSQGGIPVFIIDHDMEAIMNYTDRILVLNDGEIIANGQPKEVANDEEVIKAYLGEKYEFA